MGLSGAVSLISLSGCSRVDLSPICALLLYWGFTCWWLVCWWFLPSSVFTGIHNAHLVLYVIRGRVTEKLDKIVREYSMGFKVLTNREQIEGPWEDYSNNHDISPN